MRYFIIILTLLVNIYTYSQLKLTSPAFQDEGHIPSRYTCDGSNTSPALEWTGIPARTKTFALMVEDPDAPGQVWVHWILFNIPVSIHRLSEGVVTGEFVRGSTNFNEAQIGGSQNYGGPCPPTGEHRYQFILYALDTKLTLEPGATRSAVLSAMQGHILEKSTLVGRYKRINK